MFYHIKYLVMDVDGTLTDGRLYFGNRGEIMKVFHVKDGYAIRHLLPELGIEPVVITARTSGITAFRCSELGIARCYQGIQNKKEKLLELAGEFGVSISENGKFSDIGYIGDDLIDLECMRMCAFCACPLDAAGQVRAEAVYVSGKNAGDGAVRDIVDWYYKCCHIESTIAKMRIM